MIKFPGNPLPRRSIRLLSLLCLLGLGACGLRSASFAVPGTGELTTRVRALLGGDERASVDFRRARLELEELGPDVDTILVSIAYDRTVRPVIRANALMLLAERRVPAALTTLQWALFNSNHELVREAAVLGLNRYANESLEAQNAIRSAVADPSPRVRLNALQSLDVHDINAIRSLLRTERHPLVREIAVQYLAISESRGAPLLADETGMVRTAAPDHQPRLVFRPESVEPETKLARGQLGLEAPDGSYLPLAYDVEMVNNVLPAFLSPDRTVVVMETARSIVLRDLAERHAIYLGPGIAPRAIPFSDAFVYLRELPAAQRRTAEGVEMHYEVFRATFNGLAPTRLGELTVLSRADSPSPLSPVRWMAVGEMPEGWVLKVEGAVVFTAPHPTMTDVVDVHAEGRPGRQQENQE
jgi:hypothetical protein